MQLERQPVFLQRRKPLLPLGVREVVVVSGFAVHRLVRVEVEQVAYSSEAFGLAVSREDFFNIGGREVAVTDNYWGGGVPNVNIN